MPLIRKKSEKPWPAHYRYCEMGSQGGGARATRVIIDSTQIGRLMPAQRGGVGGIWDSRTSERWGFVVLCGWIERFFFCACESKFLDNVVIPPIPAKKKNQNKKKKSKKIQYLLLPFQPPPPAFTDNPSLCFSAWPVAILLLLSWGGGGEALSKQAGYNTKYVFTV